MLVIYNFFSLDALHHDSYDSTMFKEMKIYASDPYAVASKLEQLGYEALPIKPTHRWIVADRDGFLTGWVTAKSIDFPVVKLEDLGNAEVR